jgi:hypothetical protein
MDFVAQPEIHKDMRPEEVKNAVYEAFDKDGKGPQLAVSGFE